MDANYLFTVAFLALCGLLILIGDRDGKKQKEKQKNES